ncbi:hypothetical protein J2T49_000747 [Pseudomonas nitroreducens]|nr:hypothetical protein [Pseudomonas nitroreducens]MCP1684820.1 hypothetical protein [Pseudomonas nitroreducens]
MGAPFPEYHSEWRGECEYPIIPADKFSAQGVRK